jgi:sulfite exporter TauE/SafE
MQNRLALLIVGATMTFLGFSEFLDQVNTPQQNAFWIAITIAVLILGLLLIGIGLFRRTLSPPK